MTEVRIIVDGDERNVATGTTAADLWPDTNPPKVVAARVGGELKDLAYVLADGDVVEPVLIDSADGLAVLRHSTAHVMAQAVQDLFPGTLLGHRAADRERLLLRLRRRAAVHARGPQGRSRSGWRRSSRPGSASPAARSPTTTPAPSWPAEPYKLELIGLKGGAGDEARRPRSAAAQRSPCTTTSTPRRASGSGPTCAAARTCRPPGASRRSS